MLLSGCSLLLVDAPPAQPPPPPAIASCTSSRIPPVIDTMITAVALGGVIYFAQRDDENAGLGAAVEGALAVGFGVSAFTGWRRTSRCAAMRVSSPP